MLIIILTNRVINMNKSKHSDLKELRGIRVSLLKLHYHFYSKVNEAIKENKIYDHFFTEELCPYWNIQIWRRNDESIGYNDLLFKDPIACTFSGENFSTSQKESFFKKLVPNKGKQCAIIITPYTTNESLRESFEKIKETGYLHEQKQLRFLDDLVPFMKYRNSGLSRKETLYKLEIGCEAPAQINEKCRIRIEQIDNIIAAPDKKYSYKNY